MCVSLQRRAIKNFEMSVSLQRRAQKMYEICVSLQFRAIDTPNPARGFIQQIQNARLATAARNQKFPNARFATAACAKIYETSDRCPPQRARYKIIVLPQFRRPDQHEVTKGFAGTQKNLHFTTVLSIRRSLFALKVARRRVKSFHHSFERPTSTKWREGCLPIKSTKPTLRKKKKRF